VEFDRIILKEGFAGRFVGIIDGQVRAVAGDRDERIQRLRSIEANLHQALCLEAGLDYRQVQEIWVLC
jgi:hypothetical protein